MDCPRGTRDSALHPLVVPSDRIKQEAVEAHDDGDGDHAGKDDVGDEMPAEHDAHGPDRRAEQHGAAESKRPQLRRRQACRGDRPVGLARFTRDEGAISLAGAAWVPPGLEGLGTGKLLHEVRPRPAPILLEEEVADEPWTEQERADEEQHHRGRHQHRRGREDELAQKREHGRSEQKVGGPVEDAPDDVQRIVDGKRELGLAGIEEQAGDLQVPGGKGGEQDTYQDPNRDRCQQPVTRHGKAPEPTHT